VLRPSLPGPKHGPAISQSQIKGKKQEGLEETLEGKLKKQAGSKNQSKLWRREAESNRR
jgi:hypothetical protein